MHMTKDELIEAFEMGDLGQVEFFELAQDAGMTVQEIGQVMERAAEE